MTKPKVSESDLARHVVGWLRSMHWTVYEEVGFNGRIADIVVTRGPLLGVVECKVSLGLPVLEQCWDWVPFAHYVWAATPRSAPRSLISRVMSDYGVGQLVCWNPSSDRRADVREQIRPALRRRIDERLLKALRPEHASGRYAGAGTQSGGRFTPFAATCDALLDVVTESPGLTVKEAVSKLKGRHHYQSSVSARSALLAWIRRGVITDVVARPGDDGRTLRLYPAEAP